MGKRKRGAPRGKQDEKPSEFEDRSANKLKINSYQDVADSEDEFLHNRDKILLDEPSGKRSKRQQEEDDFLQQSDEEVLGYSASSDDDDEVGDNEDGRSDLQLNDEGSVEEDVDGVESEDAMAGWGGSKSVYYNADKITNEEEALAEEQEARRLQQKRLKSLREADFGFDEGEWASGGKEDTEEHGGDREPPDEAAGGVVRERLPQLQITSDMSDVEKLKLLRRRYPDFEGYAKTMVELQPVWKQLQREIEASSKDPHSVSSTSVTQYRAVSAYLGVLTMYFALLTSPARQAQDGSSSLPLQPQELREHEIIEYINRCKEQWVAVRDLEDTTPSVNDSASASDVDFEGIWDTTILDGVDDSMANVDRKAVKGLQRKRQAVQEVTDARAAASEARRAARRAKIAASLDQTSAQLAKPVKLSRKQPATGNGEYDLADETPLDGREAAEKARRKKSLRFYTSRIAQKANKDTRMADGAGGDEDLPYKERFRDKVERLNREAEARGRRGRDEDMHEGGESGGSDVEMTNADREALVDDDDYKELMGQVHGKKEKKRQREALFQQAKEQGARVERVAQAEIGPDGRRNIGYTISANKGLTPKRKKENKNPRTKKRRKFEDKTKKLSSMRPTFKGGEGRGGYGGELTGIKSGLVKSTKL